MSDGCNGRDVQEAASESVQDTVYHEEVPVLCDRLATRQHNTTLYSRKDHHILVHSPSNIIDTIDNPLPANTNPLGPLASKNGPIGFPQKKVKNRDRLKIHPICSALYPLSWCELKYCWKTPVELMTPNTANSAQKDPAVTDQARAPPSGNLSFAPSCGLVLLVAAVPWDSRACSDFPS